MSWLLELLIEGIRELCSQFIVDMMEIVTDMFTELLSCDLTLFEELFGVVGDLYKNVMVPMGIAILLLVCTWQLFKSMFGKAGLASEDPIELVCRSGMCLFLIVSAKYVVNYILDIAGTPYQWVAGTEIKVESFSGYVSALEGVTGSLGIDSLSIALLMLIMQFVVAWNYFKMLFVIAERYVLLGVFSYTSPLAFATGGSKSTNNILASWAKMFGGQVVLIILNSWCLKMFLSGYGNLMASSYGFTKFFVATLCLVGFCKITFKLDSYMSSLGVNLGRPSNGLGAMGLMMAAGRIFSHVGKGAAGGGESGTGATTGGQAYGNAANMTEGSGGPIPMAAGTMAGDAMDMENSTNAFGDPQENSADAEMQQGDFDSDGLTEDSGVLDELGMMPSDMSESNASTGDMNMDAGDFTNTNGEMEPQGSTEASSEAFQTEASNGDMNNSEVVLGSDSSTIGEMVDYPVEEDDFDTESSDGAAMDLEGGNIDSSGADNETGAGGMESSYGDSSSGSNIAGDNAAGQDDGIINEIGGQTTAGAMDSYSSEGIHTGDSLPHHTSGEKPGMEGQPNPDMGLYHDFNDNGDGTMFNLDGNGNETMPNLDTGGISSEKSEREVRSTNREERVREVPKSRDEIKKRKGSPKKHDEEIK